MAITKDAVSFWLNFSHNILAEKEASYVQLLRLTNEVDVLKRIPENQPLYQLNLLDVVDTEEPHTSRFLCSILNYKENSRYIILESFIESFLQLSGLTASKVNKPIIVAEQDHIDVCVRDTEYAIIIENKIRNAGFQRNQIGRYIQRVHEQYGYSFDKIFVVILPQYYSDTYVDEMLDSVWRCPADGLITSNASRRCAQNDTNSCICDGGNKHLDICDGCNDFKSQFKSRTIVLHNQLSDWLNQVVDLIDNKQIILKSAIVQFADFANGLYDNRINSHLLMDIKKVIAETILDKDVNTLSQWETVNDKIKEIEEIRGAMYDMRLKFSKDLIDEWYRILEKDYSQLRHESQKSLGILINGVWIGCWCGSDNGGSPYWGFYCPNQGNEDQKKMVKDILDECNVSTYKHSANYIAWCSTLHGVERCRNFYEAAKSLNYLQ